jgi:hypothetical protein
MADSISINLGTADGINGEWDNSSTRVIIRNLGIVADFRAASSAPYMSTVDFGNNGPGVDRNSNIDYVSGILGVNQETGIILPLQNIGDIPFGTNVACLRVNLDGTMTQESSPDPDNPDKLNNVICSSQTVDVPEPPMSIVTSEQLIRSGGSVTINWSAQTSYELNCSVLGAGSINSEPGANFDASDNGNGASAVTGSATISDITNTSEFTLQCIEPSTSETFTKIITVEVVPDFEEF